MTITLAFDDQIRRRSRTTWKIDCPLIVNVIERQRLECSNTEMKPNLPPPRRASKKSNRKVPA